MTKLITWKFGIIGSGSMGSSEHDNTRKVADWSIGDDAAFQRAWIDRRLLRLR